ncbi:MAG: SIMPL domain-containing protein, partial [Pseudomonadota bacterium]
MDRGFGLVAAAMLALGVAVSGYLVGEGFREGRKAERYVTVKGLAEKTVKADQALWMLQLTRASDDLGLVQQSLERDVAAVRSFFTQSGLSADEIGLARLEVIDQLAQAYRSQPINDNRYIINQTVKVESDKVDIVNGLQNQTNELLKLGVIVNGWSPAVFT